MNFLRKLSPIWILRIALGAMYLYSGYDLFVNPSGWIWALPLWFKNIIEPFAALESYLKIQGAAEFLTALLLLAWFTPKRLICLIALFSSLELLFILFFSPQFSITFRDIGVLGSSLALFVLTLKDSEQIEPLPNN